MSTVVADIKKFNDFRWRDHAKIKKGTQILQLGSRFHATEETFPHKVPRVTARLGVFRQERLVIGESLYQKKNNE